MFGFDTKIVRFVAGVSAILAATAYVIWGPSQSHTAKGKTRNKQGIGMTQAP